MSHGEAVNVAANLINPFNKVVKGTIMLNSTSKFEVLEILYKRDGDPGDESDSGFAIAAGYWNGDKSKREIGCRWYDNGVGYPQTFGKAQWMRLPVGAVDVDDLLKNPDSRSIDLRFS